MKTIADTTLASLRDGFQGQLITPADEQYHNARAVWNGMIDKFPALIARCTGVADVVAAVNFARTNNMPLAVRGGAHNVAGYATCDGGIVLDLSLMNKIQVDPEGRTARAEAGVRWGDLDRATQAFGLATPGGEVSMTGIAGLTLSGGIGYLRRKYGLSCDNLISVDIVTADGRALTANKNEHADLFWALQGGGGNFGVVTTFEYRLHPVGPEVATITAAYPLDQASQLLQTWREFAASAPDEITSSFAAWSIPAIPDFPAEMHGQPIIIFDGMYAGDPIEGERLFEPLRSVAEPLFDLGGVVPYVEAQSSLDPFFPDGDRYYWKSLYIDDLSDAFASSMLNWVQKRPNPRCLTVIRHLGGAISRVDASESAFGNRDAGFNLSIDATWTDPADDEANIAWARAYWQDMRRFSNGAVYLNFPGLLEEGKAAVQKAFGSKYERLVSVKRQYDPTNLFHLNANINPER